MRRVQGEGLPQEGFVRLRQVLVVIPVGKTVWWEGVKSGRYPKPVKLSARCTAWQVEDIRQLMHDIAEREAKEAEKH